MITKREVREKQRKKEKDSERKIENDEQ